MKVTVAASKIVMIHLDEVKKATSLIGEGVQIVVSDVERLSAVEIHAADKWVDEGLSRLQALGLALDPSGDGGRGVLMTEAEHFGLDKGNG